MKIRSVRAVYICPVCGNKREFFMFRDNFNLNDLCTGHKGCMTCAVGDTVSILDVLKIECNIKK